jgi:hypothetical protein
MVRDMLFAIKICLKYYALNVLVIGTFLCGVAPDQAVDLVALFEEELGQVRPILTSDPYEVAIRYRALKSHSLLVPVINATPVLGVIVAINANLLGDKIYDFKGFCGGNIDRQVRESSPCHAPFWTGDLACILPI